MAALTTISREMGVAEQMRNEGGILSAVALPALAGRIVSNWSQTSMIGGVVVSVIGVAAAIFSSNFMAAAGFGVAAIISMAGIFIADSAMRAQEWKEAMERFQGEKMFLEVQTRKMDLVQKNIKAESDR